MFFLLIEFLFNKRLDFSTFNLHFGFPLSEGFQSIPHLIHSVEVSDIELLSDLIGPVFNQLLKLYLGLLTTGDLRLQKLLERLQSRQHLLVSLDLIRPLSLRVFHNCRLQVLIILFEIFESGGDVWVCTVI